ncbi:K+/H+ antiporter subunit F [Ramlibacter tataouinensis]|uniref:Candidate multisubunit Na+/H+ antiporter, MnhF subunit n=1 Tax=Ramlibacter tataouinensis (strain ATCC BAA-407 / DSM 14655 / LMG 21543 / TTB310) TaxID=365046 RepID=F5XWC5_RAMTT|nr:K+/H+ antiporter subunit F [Ramlibacter tataouinensis]AEG91695.1 Candidate multisubunit Na+/H+ antiporter, MnhF subunit [Ramlibacter tataouinensis TTB310]
MNTSFLDAALATAQLLIGLAIVCSSIRLVLGPRAQDRVLSVDTLYVNAVLLFLTHGLRTGNPYVFESALVIAVLGFASTAALARFLLRGEVIE